MAVLIDLDALEQAAQAATPGPWTAFHYTKYREWHVNVPIEGSGMRRALFDDGCPTDRPEEDCKFIAAANPLVVLALIHQLRTAKAQRDELLAAVKNAHVLLSKVHHGGTDNYSSHEMMGCLCDCGAAIAKARGVV